MTRGGMGEGHVEDRKAVMTQGCIRMSTREVLADGAPLRLSAVGAAPLALLQVEVKLLGAPVAWVRPQARCLYGKRVLFVFAKTGISVDASPARG